jgi:hypothetical protein
MGDDDTPQYAARLAQANPEAGARDVQMFRRLPNEQDPADLALLLEAEARILERNQGSDAHNGWDGGDRVGERHSANEAAVIPPGSQCEPSPSL